MIEKIKKLSSSMAFTVTSSVVLLLAVFGIIVSASGIISFTNAFDEIHSDTTFHMAYSAASLVNGDHIDEYLEGGEVEEYNRTKRILDGFCRRMNVSLTYVIVVDQTDYGSFVSVFNAVESFSSGLRPALVVAHAPFGVRSHKVLPI